MFPSYSPVDPVAPIEDGAVEWTEGTPWRLAVRVRGSMPTVKRAIDDARREIAVHQGAPRELGDDLDLMRELPARATDGAIVRVALPIAAAAAFSETAARLENLDTLVADAASGVIRAHVVGDDDAVVRSAEALLLAARVVGGSGRVERRADHLRARLAAWPTRPNGDFLMRRIKDAFDPAGVLEPGRTAFA